MTHKVRYDLGDGVGSFDARLEIPLASPAVTVLAVPLSRSVMTARPLVVVANYASHP
jgi:hypothetical protein